MSTIGSAVRATSSLRMLIALTASLATSSSIAQQGDSGVAIGFPSRLSDAAVADLLEAHNATPARVYISSSGFTGSHSSRNAARGNITSEAFIQDARRETIAFFEKALQANAHRVHALVSGHSKEELVRDEKLNSDLRSHLRLREQFENVLRDARDGAPIIYAVDVDVDANDLQGLRANPLVRLAVTRDQATLQRQVVQSIKPQAVEEEQFLDATVALSNAQVAAKSTALIDPSRPPVRVGKPSLGQ